MVNDPRSNGGGDAGRHGARDLPGESIWSRTACVGLAVLAQSTQHAAEPLHDVRRVKLLAAFMLLTLGSLAFVLIAWFALHVGRRAVRRENRRWHRSESDRRDDWATRPVVPQDPSDGDRTLP